MLGGDADVLLAQGAAPQQVVLAIGQLGAGMGDLYLEHRGLLLLHQALCAVEVA